LRSLKTNKTKLMNVAGGFCSLHSFVHIQKFHFQVFTFFNENSLFYSKMFSTLHLIYYSSIKTAIFSLLCYTILSIHTQKKIFYYFTFFDFLLCVAFLSIIKYALIYLFFFLFQQFEHYYEWWVYKYQQRDIYLLI
jgi:hypothetical protein